jgi:hypothetical protein
LPKRILGEINWVEEIAFEEKNGALSTLFLRKDEFMMPDDFGNLMFSKTTDFSI